MTDISWDDYDVKCVALATAVDVFKVGGFEIETIDDLITAAEEIEMYLRGEAISADDDATDPALSPRNEVSKKKRFGYF